MLHFAFFLVAQQAAAVPVVESADPSVVVIPRIEARAEIDGFLDEPVWSEAARLTGFWQYEPVDGRPAEEETEVLVWYAPDAIHFGVIARDRQPGTIRATVADRDRIGGDDHVTIYLDTFNDRRRAFFFAVNPLGVQQDGVRTEGAAGAGSTYGGSFDTSPDYYYESRGRLTEDGYVVEVRVPFKSLRFPGSGPQRWGLQIERKVQRTGHTYTWTPARRASASFLAQAGVLEGLHDLERGIVFEAQPFVTAMANGERDPATDAFRRGDIEQDFGVNVRVGFTHLSLDATINPDFSQVEADAGLVTANERFDLFISEKRPFFLEGIELFATPNQLVYTRRIVQPQVGGKITGKIGGISVAHLTALDDVPGGDALFNVTRLRRDFATSSQMGVTYTDRSVVEGGDDYNRVLAADVRHVFGGMYFAEAQLGRSWTRDGDGEIDAPIWKLELDRTGKHWGFNYRLNGIGDSFVSHTGFVPRNGIISGQLMNRLSLYGSPGSTFERLTTYFDPSRTWRYGNFGLGDAIEGSDMINSSLRFRGGWEVRLNVGREFYRLDADDYASFQVERDGVLETYRGLDEVAGPVFEIGGSTPVFQRFDANLSVRRARQAIFAEASSGDVSRVKGEVAVRPNESVRIAASNTWLRITRERDGSEFARTVIPRLKLEVQPVRSLFFRAVGEYRSERQAALVDARTGAPLLVGGVQLPEWTSDGFRLDLLASYQPTPGTVAFFGYGSTSVTDDEFAFSRLSRTTDGFFVKLAYQFRR